jgi:phosphate starvation-inducible protein PhoH
MVNHNSLPPFFNSKSKGGKKQMSISSRRRKARFDKSVQLKTISPLTDGQEATFEAFSEGYNLMLHGVAGTGKTYISLYLALKEVLAGKYQEVVIVRSAVPARDQGFLPGSLEEKSNVFEAPYKAICNDLLGQNNGYDNLKQSFAINFMTTSYDRGITLNDAIIVVDELQNFRFEELDTIITRCGKNCRIIFCGDINQSDLYKANDKTGLPLFFGILQDMESFDFIEFGLEDIVRSGLVKEYITAKFKKGLEKQL